MCLLQDPAVILTRRLPFYYGWVVVAVAFVTLGLGACVRNAFSLLFPPILADLGWDRGLTASVWTVGFVTAALFVPVLGAAVDRWGPQYVLPFGAALTALGFVLTSCLDRAVALLSDARADGGRRQHDARL